jgi:PAS domain S-box-containing protein
MNRPQTVTVVKSCAQLAAVALLAAWHVAVQASFVNAGKPAWAEAAPYGLALAAALTIGLRGLLPYLAGTVVGCLLSGLPADGPTLALSLAAYLAAWTLVRAAAIPPGNPSAAMVLRLALVAGLTSLARGAAVSALCLPDAQLAAEMFFPSVLAAWIANLTLGLLVLAWGARSAWQGLSLRRAAELFGLLAGAAACAGTLSVYGAAGNIAVATPVTCLMFVLLLCLGVRFDSRGVALFQICATAAYSGYCYRELLLTQIDRPTVLITTAFLGFVNVTAMLLAASWAERRHADEARESLLKEVLRQRDELERLSAAAAVQQAFLAATFDQLPAALLTFSPDGRLRTMNAAAREWFAGFNAAIGRRFNEQVNWLTFTPAGRRVPTADCPVTRTLKTGEPARDVELRYTLRGDPAGGRTLTLNATPVMGVGGARLGVVALYLDLTDVRRNERLLRESEERLRLVMRWTRVLPVEADFETGVITGTEPFAEWFDLPPRDGQARTVGDALDGIHTADRAAVTRAIAAARAGGQESVEFSFRVPHPDGTTRHYLIRGRATPDADGRPTPRYTGVVIDITKEKADEQRLRLLESVVVHARDGVVVLEAEATAAGRAVLYANDAFLAMSGYARGELFGRSLHLLRGPDTDGGTLVRLRACLDSGDPLQAELLNYRKDGTTYWVELSIVPVPGDDGRRAYWVMIQRDVSDRKAAELALRQREDQLRQAQKMETVGQLAGGVAHDFNNLLTAVLGNLDLIKLPAGDPNRPLLATADRAARRAAELTSKLLGFARRNQMLVAPVEVAGFVADVVELLRRTIDPRITFVTDIPPLDCLALADAGLLSQVLLNLCVNARDAMPAGGELRLSAAAAPATPEQAARHAPTADVYLRLSVSDTGSGMTAEVHARLFEPFFTTKPVGQGTGLGLAMVDGIVRQHDGWVECETAEGVGTTFHVYLPAVAAVGAESTGKVVTRSNGEFVLDVPPELEPAPPPAAPNGTPRAGGRILLVDDEEMIRTISRTVLEGAGYTVREAGDGAEALDLFRVGRADIDLVILDLVMPRLSGRDASKAMAEIDPAVRILISSGYSADDVSDIPAAMGLLSKPYRPSELLAAVRGALA